MKKIVLIVFVLSIATHKSMAQNFALGVEIAPSFYTQLIKNKQSKIRSSIRGQGFSIGFSFKKSIAEYTHFMSGLKLDYAAFNQKSNQLLVSSFRITGLNLPLNFSQSFGLSTNWFYLFGGGLNYNFSNRDFLSGQWININPAINQLQPYLNLGINYHSNTNTNFEFGVSLRYYLVDIYKTQQQNISNLNTHLAAFDLSMKYYFMSK